MKSALAPWALLLLAWIPGTAGAVPEIAAPVDITVGETKLTIPVPPGFELLTADMEPAYDFAKRFVYSTNEEFALFLPADQIAAAKKLEIPNLDRKLSVQVEQDAVARFIANDRFAADKQTLKAYLADAIKQVEAKAPGTVQRLAQGLGPDDRLDPKLTDQQVIPLPAHDEGERKISFSMVIVVNNENPTGTVSTGVLAATVSHVHVEGKVLLLNVIGGETDLAWSRSISRNWVEAVLAANPSSPETAKAEAAPTPFEIDWDKVAWGAGLLAGLGAGAWFLLKHRRKRIPVA